MIHINLIRPLVFVQPVAVDRAILFWLSYKNAWEYWTEQRLNLNKEVLAATEQVLEKVPISQITSHLSSQQVGTLFLQLNVQDIGICIPFLSPADIWAANTQLPSSKLDVGDSRGAIVATVESSSVSACSAGSTVSTGKFTGKSIMAFSKRIWLHCVKTTWKQSREQFRFRLFSGLHS